MTELESGRSDVLCRRADQNQISRSQLQPRATKITSNNHPETIKMQQQPNNNMSLNSSNSTGDGLSTHLPTESIFEWNEEKCLLLCFGYLRQFIKIGISDIGSILYKYLSSMMFDYHINNNKYSSIKYMSDNTFLLDFTTKNTKNNDDIKGKKRPRGHDIQPLYLHLLFLKYY